MTGSSSSLTKQEKSAKAVKLLTDFPTYDTFCLRFNPANQMKLAMAKPNHVTCFQYDYPTLGTVYGAYGEKAVINWLKIQFENLNDYVGAKEKLNLDQLSELSTLIFSDCYFLNISEVFLFFLQLKSGKFCEFFGYIDPVKIMKAKNDFLENRRNELRLHDEALKKAQLIDRMEGWSKNAISYEDYRKLKKQKNKAKVRNLSWKKIIRKRI